MFADLQCVVLDCPDPRRLADFYRSLLGGTVDQPDPRWAVDAGWSTLHLPSGLVLGFQRATDYRPPMWPDPARPQQFHLDFAVADLDEAHKEALTAGATVLDADMDGRGWSVYADPAGHPFCLLRH
ncbi:VOC family protein [Nonomuraea sp. NBC_01738]|uniref:VOC family protein n=1 Tax=Nonomuraea sp. NBC_01738 TaxID=2976003 RepID=UPI002E13BFB2|nr:VOC family protein [Nonomuraea sp. NBC_01738]